MTRLRTSQQVKADFAAKGITIKDWADENGFPEMSVYQVVNGYTKGTRGKSHAIAVALGMKPNPDTAAA